MLNREQVLAWCEVEHDLYEENGNVFGVMLDIFNEHKTFYWRYGNTYIDLPNDVYDAIDMFNEIVSRGEFV